MYKRQVGDRLVVMLQVLNYEDLVLNLRILMVESMQNLLVLKVSIFILITPNYLEYMMVKEQ